MGKTLKLSAILVANQLDLKGIKASLQIKTLADSSTELFYGFENDKYVCYFNYGVIVFSGHPEEEIEQAIAAVRSNMKSPVEKRMRDDHEISVVPGNKIAFDFDRLVVDHLDERVVRITMFNLAQSVALDKYHDVTEDLLTEVRGFTRVLEASGRLNISRKNMLKFIGKALNMQNDIAENIYIFDAPELAWEDEYLDDLHKGLMKYFDLKVRFGEIEYTLRIIEDNLAVFREISNQRQSNMLEWIIIILIVVELLNVFIVKLF